MFPLLYQAKSTSTNDDVLEYVNTLIDGAALYTFHQTQGRGQYGNSWKSSTNENVAYSLAIKEKLIHNSNSLFNFHTALILRDFIANLTNEEVFVKWPNDIIIHRKKVSGLLIEKKKNETDFYFVIGIGINVLQSVFDDLSKAGSILTQTSKAYDLHEFTQAFHQYLTAHLVADTAFPILEQYNQHLFKKGSVALFSKDNQRQNGIIQYADENGFLWIELEKDGLQKFFHKEIEMLY